MSLSPVDDVGVFAERVLRRPLWPHQLEAACSGRFVTTIAAARRTGKTTLVETLAAWTCFRERGVKAVILSAGQDSARRVTESIGATLAASDLTRGALVEDFATRIRLTNGSEIVSLPASQRQVRGFGRGVKLLVLDEAGFVPEELWRAARYVALDERGNGSRILLCGTPWGGPDLFFRRAFEAGEDGDEEHASFQWTYEVNPLLDHAYLRRERDRTAPAEYAAEVLGEWSDAVGSLFPRSLLDSQTADVELPAFPTIPGEARPAVGVDFGVSFDRSAAVALYRLPVAQLNPDAPVLPRFVVVPKVYPRAYPLHEVVVDVAALPASPFVLSTETSGVGAGPSQELLGLVTCTRNQVATTNASKTAGYGGILSLLERGQLVLPRDPDLLRQLAGLRFEQGERGFTRIEAESPAVHDDIADALYLAGGTHRPPGARQIAVALLQWADPAKAPGDQFSPSMHDAEVLETGGGLRVWRRPPLQSVAGFELSPPIPSTERAAQGRQLIPVGG